MGRFGHMMTQTITVATGTTLDDFGEVATFGTQTTQKAHVEGITRGIFDVDGHRIEASNLIITETEIDPDARIWLPWDDTTDNTIAKRIVKTDRVRAHRDGYTIFEYAVR